MLFEVTSLKLKNDRCVVYVHVVCLNALGQKYIIYITRYLQFSVMGLNIGI